MHMTRKLCYCITRRMLNMCFPTESRIFIYQRINKSPCSVALRKLYSNYPPGHVHTNRFSKYVSVSRILSVNRNNGILPRTASDCSWNLTVKKTKLPLLVDVNNVSCCLCARELYTTSVLANKERTPKDVDPSVKEASEETESSDTSKGWVWVFCEVLV